MVILLPCPDCDALMRRVGETQMVRCINGHEHEVHGYLAWNSPAGQIMQMLLDKGMMNTALEDMGLPPVVAD